MCLRVVVPSPRGAPRGAPPRPTHAPPRAQPRSLARIALHNICRELILFLFQIQILIGRRLLLLIPAHLSSTSALPRAPWPFACESNNKETRAHDHREQARGFLFDPLFFLLFEFFGREARGRGMKQPGSNGTGFMQPRQHWRIIQTCSLHSGSTCHRPPPARALPRAPRIRPERR